MSVISHIFTNIDYNVPDYRLPVKSLTILILKGD